MSVIVERVSSPEKAALLQENVGDEMWDIR